MKKANTNKMVKKAFTLMELIIVIVIIGALTAIAVGKLSGGTDSARIAEMKSDMKQVVSVINTQYATNQTWPDPLPAYNHSPNTSVAYKDGEGTAAFRLEATVTLDNGSTKKWCYDNNTGTMAVAEGACP